MPALGSTVFSEAIVFCTYGFNLNITYLSLVFLVSGTWYEALYETSFASVLFDFTLRVR